MAHVVLLRGVNVGGHRRFRPSQVARDLASQGVESVGAAGTFVTRDRAGAEAVLAALPVEANAIVVARGPLSAFVASNPFGDVPARSDLRRLVTFLSAKPAKEPDLPLDAPEGRWQVRLVARDGPFVASLWRPDRKRLLYPNEVVEKAFGVPATTRSWDTVETVLARATRSRRPA